MNLNDELDVKLFSRFSQLNELPLPLQEKLKPNAKLVTFKKGDTIFKEGINDGRILYLVDGEVTLLSKNTILDIVNAESYLAHRPLIQENSLFTGRANGPCTVLALDAALLNAHLKQAAFLSDYDVTEINADGQFNWATLFTKLRSLLKLPIGNIQAILSRLQELTVDPDQLVITQGTKGDEYYIVKQGRFSVFYKPNHSRSEFELATLEQGDCFGEEALISHSARSASVRAVDDGRLMRLSRRDFMTLLVNPILNPLTYPLAAAKTKENAVFLDVRSPDEHALNGIADSINIPLPLLRSEMRSLDPDLEYITYCDSAYLSAAASFVMSQWSFKTHVLAGGLRNATRLSQLPRPA